MTPVTMVVPPDTITASHSVPQLSSQARQYVDASRFPDWRLTSIVGAEAGAWSNKDWVISQEMASKPYPASMAEYGGQVGFEGPLWQQSVPLQGTHTGRGLRPDILEWQDGYSWT